MTTGLIYLATAPSGKGYVGQTIQPLAQRIYAHRRGEYDTPFSRAVAKYGDAIEWRVLARLEVEGLDAAEQYFIAVCGTMSPQGYNLKSGGGSGVEYSPESRAKMSASHKGQKSWSKGKKLTPEHRAKLSAAKKGKPSGRKGIPHSAKTCAQISASLTGYKHTPEARANMAASHIGRKMPPRTAEHRANQSAAKRGKKWSAARRAAQNRRVL